MKILATGAAGYIGGSFVYEALQKKYKVTGLDNFSNSKPSTIKKIQQAFPENFSFYEIDLSSDKHLLEKILKDLKPDVVAHFAGLKCISESELYPNTYWENNFQSSKNILFAMHGSGCKKIIFSSSAAVYDPANTQPLSESSDLKALSVYGETKIAVEEIYKAAAEEGIIDVLSLRYFNPLGVHRARIVSDNIESKSANLMPKILRVALNLDQAVKVFGDDYTTKDGSGERDYIHINDLVSGHFSAIKYLESNNGYHVFNLGTGKSVSVFKLLKTFEKVNAIKIPITIAERRIGDVAVCYADPKRAKDILKWEAKETLDKMCLDAWRAIEKNGFN